MTQRPHLREFFALPPEDRNAWLGFLRTHALVVRELDAELEREHGLTLNSYDVLVQLVLAPDMRMQMSELAERALITRAGMTRLVDRLEADGLIERQSGERDTRQVFAKITDRGLDKLENAARTHFAGIERTFLAPLSRDQRETLAAAWATILESRSQRPGGLRSRTA